MKKIDAFRSDIFCRRYILAYVLVVVLLFILLSSTIYVLRNSLPAPRISASESFNEKARFIKGSGVPGCDILIIGSSMALNNIDASLLKSMTGAKTILNAGSWGLSVHESAIILAYLTPICKPKVILLAAFYGDFDTAADKLIKWDRFEKYIMGEPILLSYFNALDPMYYYSKYKNGKLKLNKGNSVYESLNFDNSGSVMLNCGRFEFLPARWDAQDKYSPIRTDGVRENLWGLTTIENTAKTSRAKLLVVATPMRQKAREKLAKPELSRLWEAVDQSVVRSGGEFVDTRTRLDFSDSYFADFVHLNACGSKKLTEIIAPKVTHLLSLAP